MREYGKVFTTFWQSDDMRGLSEDGRMLALYLMTCPHGNMLGCFRMPESYAAEDLQWESGRVREGFSELFAKGFAYRCERTFWVFIRQYLKWNPFENPNVATKALNLVGSLRIPNTQKGLLLLALRDFGKHFDPRKLDQIEAELEPFANPFETISKTRTITITRTIAVTKPEPEPQPKAKSEVERRGATPDRDLVPKIFEFWQDVMKSPKSKLDAKRIDIIRKALKMGYKPRDLCEAIRGCALSPFHMGQNDRKTKYNGLDLIFRSADKIDAFIVLAEGGATSSGEESMEQRNARITAELLGPDDHHRDDDGDVIEMEAA